MQTLSQKAALIFAAFLLTACASMPAPSVDRDHNGIIALDNDSDVDAPAETLRIKAVLTLGEFTKEVEFGMLNATQGNYVRFYPKEGFNVIVNMLPVIDPNRRGIIDAQYQLEVSERRRDGEQMADPRVVQVQNEYLFHDGKPQEILNSDGARFTVTISHVHPKK
jgi:hypothetical protein